MNVNGLDSSFSLTSRQVSQYASRKEMTSSCIGSAESGDALVDGALAKACTLAKSAKRAS